MKRLFLTLGLFSISILSCTSDTNDPKSVNGSWTVYSFENLTTGTTEFKNRENSWNKDIKIQFDDTKNPQVISGTNISNQIFGEFSYVRKNQFKVANLGSTYAGQPRWADQFVVAIQDQSLTYKITYDLLVIYYDGKSKSVTLKRE